MASPKNDRCNDTSSVRGANKKTHAQHDDHNTNNFIVNAGKSWIQLNVYYHTKKTKNHQYCMTHFSVSRAGDRHLKQDKDFRVVRAKKYGGYRGAKYSNKENP